MTDREKLIEILRKPIFPHDLADPTEAVADYLLDNGVTVRKTGRWISRDTYIWGCSSCRKLSVFTYDFCPNCGAKMEV